VGRQAPRFFGAQENVPAAESEVPGPDALEKVPAAESEVPGPDAQEKVPLEDAQGKVPLEDAQEKVHDATTSGAHGAGSEQNKDHGGAEQRTWGPSEALKAAYIGLAGVVVAVFHEHITRELRIALCVSKLTSCPELSVTKDLKLTGEIPGHLDNVLEELAKGFPTSFVDGVLGIGKTTVLKKFSNSRRKTQGVFWVRYKLPKGKKDANGNKDASEIFCDGTSHL
jgi:hypothetical protein